MGAPKKIDVYRNSLTAEDLAEEDAASRGRIDRYKAMKLGPARTAALKAEQDWRVDIGLAPVELS